MMLPVPPCEKPWWNHCGPFDEKLLSIALSGMVSQVKNPYIHLQTWYSWRSGHASGRTPWAKVSPRSWENRSHNCGHCLVGPFMLLQPILRSEKKINVGSCADWRANCPYYYTNKPFASINVQLIYFVSHLRKKKIIFKSAFGRNRLVQFVYTKAIDLPMWHPSYWVFWHICFTAIFFNCKWPPTSFLPAAPSSAALLSLWSPAEPPISKNTNTQTNLGLLPSLKLT